MKVKLISNGILDATFKREDGDYIIWNGDIIKNIEGILTYLSGGNVDIIHSSITDVIDNPSDDYYFVLDTSTFEYDVILEFFKSDCGLVSQLNTLMKLNNVKFVFINFHEPDKSYFLKKFVINIENIGMDLNKLYIITNDSKINEMNLKCNVFKSQHLAVTFGGNFLKKEISFKPEKNGKFFMCQNRSARPHRLTLLSYLNNNGILMDTNYSYLYKLEGYDMDNYFLEDEYSLYKKDIHIINSSITNMENETSKMADPNFDFQMISTTQDNINSYVNITTESRFYEDCIHITEKSFKPFVFYQLPIIVGTHLHNKYLKNEYGFDLYEDLFDLSFDLESNDNLRMKMIVDEINRIHGIKNEVVLYYKENKDRLEKNRQIVRDIVETQPDLEHFKKIFL